MDDILLAPYITGLTNSLKGSQYPQVHKLQSLQNRFKLLFVFTKCQGRAYFRKVGRACSMDKKAHILVNLGQFKDGNPLNSIEI